MPSGDILACDLGGTRFRVALVSPDGEVRQRASQLIADSNPGSLISAMTKLAADAPDGASGAVIGVPGMVDYASGSALRLPNLPDGWEAMMNEQALSTELGLRTLLANDADLGALGEQRFGAGRGIEDVVYVVAGTGVGAGITLNGRLARGRYSIGEIGHTIIDRETSQSVEQLASGVALRRKRGIAVSELAAQAEAGDTEAKAMFERLTADLAIAIYNLSLLFSPQIVVVGGGMTNAGEALLQPARRLLASSGPYSLIAKTKVVMAAAGDDVGLKGAAAYWADAQTS